MSKSNDHQETFYYSNVKRSLPHPNIVAHPCALLPLPLSLKTHTSPDNSLSVPDKCTLAARLYFYLFNSRFPKRAHIS